MRRIINALMISALCCSSATSQRYLETVFEHVASFNHQNNISYEGRLYFAQHGTNYLLRYNDASFTRIDYPVDPVTGYGLYYDYGRTSMTHFESAIFITLARMEHPYAPRYFYRYDGSFSRILITGNVVSNCFVYGSYLCFITENSSGIFRMYRYAHGLVTEVPGPNFPRSYGYRLHEAGGNLYISGHDALEGENFIWRYNGSSFFTVPWAGSGTDVKEIFAAPGTSGVYFISYGREILYFDGATVREVLSNPEDRIRQLDVRMWRNELFVAATMYGGTPGTNQFYRISGSSLSTVSLPPGYQLPRFTNPEIYMDELYIGVYFSDGTSHVLRYDGTSFSTFFSFPTLLAFQGIRLSLRNGNLIFHSIDPGTSAFEYNGTDFAEINAPAGHRVISYINSTECNHIWMTNFTAPEGYSFNTYAKESRDCPPPPPPGPGPTIVIPDSLRGFERFEISNYALERGWCWNEIIIDWDIIPHCPLPPCPETNFQLQMVDANDGNAWSEQFSKPSKFTIPLKDDQSFRTILSSPDNKTDLIIFEPDLVPKGIEVIKLYMEPKNGLFTISASTRKDEPVPLRVALLDEEGKEIWMQTFVAPFSMEITATVQKPGKTLVFSIPDTKMNFVTKLK